MKNAYMMKKSLSYSPLLEKTDSMTGIEFEDFVIDLLKTSGYRNIKRTRRSGDYGVDILAEYSGAKYAFQCKRYKDSVGVKAVQEVFSGMRFYGCDRAIVVTNSSFTSNALNMAEEIDVELWDRLKLSQIAEQDSEKFMFMMNERIMRSLKAVTASPSHTSGWLMNIISFIYVIQAFIFPNGISFFISLFFCGIGTVLLVSDEHKK